MKGGGGGTPSKRGGGGISPSSVSPVGTSGLSEGGGRGSSSPWKKKKFQIHPKKTTK